MTTVQPIALDYSSSVFIQELLSASDDDWLLLIINGEFKGLCLNLSKAKEEFETDIRKAIQNIALAEKIYRKNDTRKNVLEYLEKDLERAEKRLILGRNSGLCLCLSSDNISREHVQFFFEKDSTWTLKDLGSTNGTTLGNKKLNPHQKYSIKNGDEIQLAFTKTCFGEKRWIIENKEHLIESICKAKSTATEVATRIPHPIAVAKYWMDSAPSDSDKCLSAFRGIENLFKFLVGVLFGLISSHGDKQLLSSTAERVVAWKKFSQNRVTMGGWLSLLRCLSISLEEAKGEPSSIPDWFFDSLREQLPHVIDNLQELLALRNEFAHSSSTGMKVYTEELRRLTRLLNTNLSRLSFFAQTKFVAVHSSENSTDNSVVYDAYLLNGNTSNFPIVKLVHSMDSKLKKKWCYLYFDEHSGVIPLSPFIILDKHPDFHINTLYVKDTISWGPAGLEDTYVSLNYGNKIEHNVWFYNQGSFFDLLMEASFA